MTLHVALVVAAALLAFAAGGAILRRSLPGLLAAMLTGAAGAVLLAVALLGRTGPSISQGHVIAAAIIVLAVAAAVVAIAIHVATVRSARRVDRLEPW